jgi:hypothetical protein
MVTSSHLQLLQGGWKKHPSQSIAISSAMKLVTAVTFVIVTAGMIRDDTAIFTEAFLSHSHHNHRRPLSSSLSYRHSDPSSSSSSEPIVSSSFSSTTSKTTDDQQEDTIPGSSASSDVKSSTFPTTFSANITPAAATEAAAGTTMTKTVTASTAKKPVSGAAAYSYFAVEAPPPSVTSPSTSSNTIVVDAADEVDLDSDLESKTEPKTITADYDQNTSTEEMVVLDALLFQKDDAETDDGENTLTSVIQSYFAIDSEEDWEALEKINGEVAQAQEGIVRTTTDDGTMNENEHENHPTKKQRLVASADSDEILFNGDDDDDDFHQDNQDDNKDSSISQMMSDDGPTYDGDVVEASSEVVDKSDEDVEWSLLPKQQDDDDDDDDEEIDEETENSADSTLNHSSDDEESASPIDGSADEDKIDNAIRDFTSAIRDVAVDGSWALLKGLRYTAAAALTSTLPKKEREELMGRIITTAHIGPATAEDLRDDEDRAIVDIESDSFDDIRGSVQEEIALAVREELRRNEELWLEERDVIAAQLEEAANARVEAELKIQQQRLNDEKEKWQQTELKSMRADLKEQITYLQQQLRQAENARQQVLDEDVSVAVQKAKKELVEQEAQKLEDIQSLLKKRREQQKKLDAVEESLRQRAAEIKAEKMKVERLERQKTLSSALSSFGNISPGVISSVPRHLLPKQYRSLSQNDKRQLKEHRSNAKQLSYIPDSDSLETTNGSSSAPDGKSTAVKLQHPILGPLVADLGYKKIYLASSGKLGTIPIWSKQRTYRNDRARRMAVEKALTLHIGFPGVVCLFEDTDGALSILDGQHRIGMMQALREQRNKQKEQRGEMGQSDGVDGANDKYEAFFDNVLVEVYSAKSSIQRAAIDPKEVFMEINKAEPVHLVDMPGVASSHDRKVIDDAVETLQAKFPHMFSSSQKCRVPNVNIDNLRNALFGANVLKRIGIKDTERKTSNHLFEWLILVNARLGEKYESYFEKNGKPMFVSQKAWNKARRNGFYLGLESSWLYQKETV